MEITFRDQKINLFRVLGFVLAGFIIYRISDLLTPFFLAALLTYFLLPPVEYFCHRKVPRTGAILIVYCLLFSLIGLTLFYLVPIVLAQLYRFADALPGFSTQVQNYLDYAEARYSQIDLPDSLRLILDQRILQAETYALALVNRVLESFFNLFRNLLNIILAPLFSFYLLKDTDKIRKAFYNLFPAIQRPRITRILSESNRVLSNFFRGQMLVNAILAAMYTIAYLIMQVRFAVVLGLVGGITNFVPYIGPFAGTIAAVIIAMFTSTNLAIAVIVISFILQMIEGYIIRPYIMESSVGLHPLVIVLALLVGAKFFGLPGMVFSVPAAGIIRVLIKNDIKDIIARLI